MQLNYKIHKIKEHIICELISDDIIINNLQDAIDILGNAHYLAVNKIILYQNQLSPDFFDLKTRLAGDILQKFSNYRMQLAIVGNFEDIKSKSLKDFIYECNQIGQIIFVADFESAILRLTK